MMTPEAMQAADIVSQGANNGQIITWTAVAMAVVSNVATWITIWKKENKIKTFPAPGSSKLCQDRGERIKATETEVKGIIDDIKEIKSDIRDIRNVVIGK